MSGHPDQKGAPDKPNTNANDQLDVAADRQTNPQDVLPVPTGDAEKRARDAATNPSATERPDRPKNSL